MNIVVSGAMRAEKDASGHLFARATCSSCGKTENIFLRSAGQLLVPEFIDKRLRNYGWTPGRDRKRDICNICTQLRYLKGKPQVEDQDQQFDDALAALGVSPPTKETTVFRTSQIEEDRPAPPEKTKKHFLTRAETFKIQSFMAPLVKQIGNGFVQYVDGWTDDRVLKECGVDGATIRNIENLRADTFGRIKPVISTSTINRIDALEKRIADLEGMVLELMSKK